MSLSWLLSKISEPGVYLMFYQQISSALRNNDRSNKGSTNRASTASRRQGSTRSSNLTSLITNFGSIVDKVEVYNSVEVRVASSSAPSQSHPEDLIKSTRGFSPRSAASKFRINKWQLDSFFKTKIFIIAAAEEEIEEAVFCLTPSKLFMVIIQLIHWYFQSFWIILKFLFILRLLEYFLLFWFLLCCLRYAYAFEFARIKTVFSRNLPATNNYIIHTLHHLRAF